MKKHRFKHKESYLHEHAKIVLKTWLIKFPERFGLDEIVSIRTEESFGESGIMIFKPDITVYNSDGLINIYEICHKSPLKGEKLSRMQYYFFKNKENPTIFELKAEYIMRQIKCPVKINMQRFELFANATW